MPSNPPKIDQWKKDIETITSDVTDTIENQFVFKRLIEIVKANPQIGNEDNLFWDYLTANFGAGLVLGVARQVDDRPEVISLRKLLRDIKENASVMTRLWFIEQYAERGMVHFGDPHFTERFGLKPEIDTAIVEKDIADLVAATKKVEMFRHTRIAHKNVDKTFVIDLNFGEIEVALKVVEELVIKYQLLLTKVVIASLCRQCIMTGRQYSRHNGSLKTTFQAQDSF